MRYFDEGQTYLVLSPSSIGVYPCRQDDVMTFDRVWAPDAAIDRARPYLPQVRLGFLMFVARWCVYG